MRLALNESASKPVNSHPGSAKVSSPKVAPSSASMRATLREQWFAAEVIRLIDRLEPHKAFFAHLKSTGGAASIIIQFIGDGYFWDEIPTVTLAKLVDLEIGSCHWKFFQNLGDERSMKLRCHYRPA